MTLSADIAPAILTTADLNLPSVETFRDPYWQPLEKSGFNISLHLRKLQTESLRLLQEGQNWTEIVEFCQKETSAEVRGFWLEYLCRFSVLPIPIKKGLVASRQEVVVPYSGEPFLSTINGTERDGLVKDSFVQIVEFLKTAPEGSMALLVSPPGWSNLEDACGQPINYLETQIYAYRIEKDQIEGVTIITDGRLETDEDLISWLKKAPLPCSGGQKERIKKVVASPLFFSGEKEPLTFEQLLEEIAFVKGSPLARGQTTFTELKEQLTNRNRLLKGNQAVRELIDRLEAKISGCLVDPSASSFLEVGKHLTDTLVLLSSLSESNPSEALDWSYLQKVLADTSRRQAEMERISTLTGCSGGGITMMFVLGPNGPRLVSVEKRGRFRHCGGCSQGKNKQEFGSNEVVCEKAVPV